MNDIVTDPAALSSPSPLGNPAAPISIEEERKRLDRITQILIGRDFELQKAYDSLEQAFNQVAHEKRDLLIEKNKLALVFSSITDGILALDNHFDIVALNKVAESITGYTQTDALSKNFNDLITLSEDDTVINSVVLHHGEADARGIIAQKEAIKVTGRNKFAFANVQTARIVGGEGSNVGYIVTLHDLTEQRRLEEMKLDFVSMAAHELRTPLTAISGYLSVFMHENTDKFSAEQFTFLNRINVSAQRLHALVENLLSVSKIERNAMTVNRHPVDWATHVKQTVEDFGTQAKEEGVEVKFIEPAAPLPQLNVDIIRVGEVLNNLVSNAITYTKKGDTVEVSVEVKDNMMVTHVHDHGPGIPQSAIPHLFTKFFRISGLLEQGSKGTGLGLYISKTIVEMHNGHIWVDSIEGQGATFSFSLPI